MMTIADVVNDVFIETLRQLRGPRRRRYEARRIELDEAELFEAIEAAAHRVGPGRDCSLCLQCGKRNNEVVTRLAFDGVARCAWCWSAIAAAQRSALEIPGHKPPPAGDR